jgi:DNA-directed RNA polymerase specialized sigma24 family protein
VLPSTPTEGTITVPPKKKVTLPDHVREAVLSDVELSHEVAVQADENDKIRIYLAVEQGITTQEIGHRLGAAQTTVSRWRRQGEEAYRRREQARSGRPGGDPDRPAELGAVGV